MPGLMLIASSISTSCSARIALCALDAFPAYAYGTHMVLACLSTALAASARWAASMGSWMEM